MGEQSTSISKIPVSVGPGIGCWCNNEYLRLGKKLDATETQVKSLSSRITELNSRNQSNENTISLLIELLEAQRTSLEAKEMKLPKLEQKLDATETQQINDLHAKVESLSNRITELNSQNQSHENTISILIELSETQRTSLEAKERKLLITTSVLVKVVKDMPKMKIQAETCSSESSQD